MLSRIENVTANGTAVEGVCVTWRNPPVDYPGCEQGTVTVGRQVWRNFCDHGEPKKLNETVIPVEPPC